nr:MAG TPA: Protein SCAI [Caudoviricetes sp.]
MLQCLHMRYHYFRPQHPANPHKHLLFTPFVILPCLINATV